MSILGVFHGTYDPAKVVITFDSVIIHGFTDGDYVEGKYDEERYFKLRGVDGEVGRSRNPSRSGQVDITLLQSSPANGDLNKFVAGTGESRVGPLSIQDLSGNSLLFSAKAWIKASPDFTRGIELGECKWIFDCADLEMLHGGTQDNSLLSFIGL